ncbi:MAG: cold shock domain-containing protein [Candidatus Promineifilaceae bacterium]
MENFSDHWETDADGNEFIFTVEMQRRLSEAGLPVEVEYLDQLPSAPAAPQPQRREERAPEPSSSKDEISEPESIQIDPMSGKYVGRIKWYNARKGYGFLLRGAGEEIFFHRSNTIGDAEELRDGLWVLYDVEETDKGPEATDIETYDRPE